MKMQKEKAEQQAAFNAKYAAEQKQRADMLAMALAKSEAEKAALESAKVRYYELSPLSTVKDNFNVIFILLLCVLFGLMKFFTTTPLQL